MDMDSEIIRELKRVAEFYKSSDMQDDLHPISVLSLRISRLEAENAELRQRAEEAEVLFNAGSIDTNLQLQHQITTLEAEIQRLREALERIHEGACRQLAEPRNHADDQYALTAIATECETTRATLTKGRFEL